MLAIVRRSSRVLLVAGLKNKTSHGIKEAVTDFKIELRGVWRFHTDRGKEFTGELDSWLRDNLVVHTTTAGYDSSANGIAEKAIQ